MKMEIYHGNYLVVKEPKIIPGRYTKDFGIGFYCTQLKQQAERWAGKFDTPCVNVYEYESHGLLNILNFEVMTDEWLDFVAASRNGEIHQYDIVIGPMADDQIYNYVADYMNKIITREQFWSLAKFKYPTHQIAFCTEASLKCITFKSNYRL
jgi:hypothetical protein